LTLEWGGGRARGMKYREMGERIGMAETIMGEKHEQDGPADKAGDGAGEGEGGGENAGGAGGRGGDGYPADDGDHDAAVSGAVVLGEEDVLGDAAGGAGGVLEGTSGKAEGG